MDELGEKSKSINLNKPSVALNSSTTETDKKDDVNQVVRSSHEPTAKSVSCTEFPTKYLKSASCTAMEEQTLFFNEKGWPVKIMRLTEDSPPKTMKPWPTRSLPTTSCKKSPRKEKSIYTNKKPAVANRVRPRTEASKEDKENNKTKTTKISLTNNISEVAVEKSDKKGQVTNGKIPEGAEKSDLKFMLQKLDQTIDKLTSEKDSDQFKASTATKKTNKLQKKSSPERNKQPNDKKDCIINSARSNKYNSKEVKAYMQAKRMERKMQMSEETRKRQDLLEIQKKNLEKLREKALQVLKKSSSKSVDENKPKWQGPLEEDNSEILPPAIHIFETKIPTARKSKTKPDETETPNQINSDREFMNEKPTRETEKCQLKSGEVTEPPPKPSEQETMDSTKGNFEVKKTRKRLRMSTVKPSLENSAVNIGIEAAAMEIIPQLELQMKNVRRSLESQMQSSKPPSDWDFQHSIIETKDFPDAPNNSRRTTFTCTPRTSLVPPLEAPAEHVTSPLVSSCLDVSQTNSYRKRHQVSPTKTNNLSPKKPCVNPVEGVINNRVSNTLENHLRKIQEEIAQKEEKETNKLLSLIKPDGFSVMNVMKMKLLANENKYISKVNVKENRHQKVLTTKNSFDDDTDAPSIISMEEDFRSHPEPLRLSDLELKLDRSEQTSAVSPSLSPAVMKTSRSSRRNGVDSLKSSSVSSYTFDAPPLVVPESMQNLKLSSNLSSELSYSSKKISNSRSDSVDQKVLSYTHSPKSFQDKELSLYSTSSQGKNSQCEHSKNIKSREDSVYSGLQHEETRSEVQTIKGSNPAALFLQFHAELSRLDAFDQSLAQVIAAERLHSMAGHLHQCGVGSARPSGPREVGTVSRASQRSPAHDLPLSEPKASPTSEASSVRTVTSFQGPPHASRSSSSVQSVAEHLSPAPDQLQSEGHKLSPLVSIASSAPFSLSPKSIHILQVLIDDAQFQRKQVELMYKTQEDILMSQYKAELSEIEVRYRRDGQLTNKGLEFKRIIEEKYERPLSKLRERRDQALSNSDARIEYLTKQILWLKKQKKKASKSRSADASPKKLTPLRSISLTSVVENTSSSESSAGLQTFDDKKRQDSERDKSSMSSRRKLEREMLWKLQEELARVQELHKVDRSPKSCRSRRDKSTSPLESVPETSTRDAACSVTEDQDNGSLQATSSLQTVEEARSTDVYNSESFESPESSETPRQPKLIAKMPLSSKPFVAARANSKSKVMIKVPLSPRVQVRSKRCGSSGSDESLLLSQNETQSEQSDYEVRISALKEQKRQRFAELNRLERELKRAQREQLKATEAALVKQIQAYELKIAQTKKQLEEVTSTNIVRPQIKHPRVSDKFLPRTSDVVQKPQISEELPKQQENASDLETNSLKSVSEASSTETTIQSSGRVVTSKPSLEGDDDSKDLASVGSEVTEALSSVATEGPTVLDTQRSTESQPLDPSEAVVTEPANVSADAVNWMDAEEFFNQMEIPEKDLSNEVEHSKASSDNTVSTGTPDTNISEELADSQSKSKSNSSSQEFEDAEEIITSPKTEPPNNSISKVESGGENSPQEELDILTASPEKDGSLDQSDKGRVVSVISESPPSRRSGSDVQSSITTDLLSGSRNSLPSLNPESDVSQYDDDVNISNVVSEKSEGSEILSQSVEVSIAENSDVTSKSLPGDDGNSSNTVSFVDENCNSSHSELIRVFVSNKNQESKETDNCKVLNETFLISEGETKSCKDDSVVDNITDKILQNLLNECFSCNKNNQTTNAEELYPEEKPDDRTLRANDDIKNQLSVNDITQSVLNKYLKEATDCVLKIRDNKKTAQIKNQSIDHSKENGLMCNDVSSNKLLEALALESKRTASEKGREEITPSPKSTRISNNEAGLSEGNDSEVFWFDEDLAPVSLQTAREAEELRLKELQIEQEIQQIKQLEAQESIPIYYLREIPNKPPPPYTPPGQAKDLRPVPQRREDVEALVATATRGLLAAWRAESDLSVAEPTDDYSSVKLGNQVYNKFLFDLVKQIFIDVTSNDGDEKDLPPWERTGCRIKRLVLPRLTDESVSDFVMKKVRVLFGFEPDSIKENLIIQWSRKKRDRVDELLVRESQEEERDWTDYSKCEVAVKNNVALSIFDNLVEETGDAVSKALKKKLAYCQQLT